MGRGAVEDGADLSRPAPNRRQYKLWACLPDIHVDLHDRRLLAAICDYLADERWDGMVQLGDFLDLNCIARFNDGLPGRMLDQTLEGDFEAGREVLDALLAGLRANNRKARAVILEGNHEYRLVTRAEKDTELRGSLDFDKRMGLAERNVEWLRAWSRNEMLVIGDVAFHHGKYTNVYNARKHAQAFSGQHLYYGHTHTVQEHHELLIGRSTIMAKSLGTLSGPLEWTHGDPDRWVPAFAVFYFFPDGTHQEFTIKPVGGRFVAPNGKVYGRRQV